MKRIYLLFALSIFGAGAFAQSDVRFGVKAGVSSSNVRGDAMQSLNNVLDFTKGMVKSQAGTGFYAGVTAEIPVGGDLYVEPGVMYSQKGYDFKGEFNMKGLSLLGVNARAGLNLDYIDVPLHLKYKTNGLTIFGGPQVSYLANADVVAKAGLFGINLLNKTVDVSNQFNKWDAAVTAGVGYDISPSLNIHAAYDYGLTKIDANRNTDAFNNAFRVGLALRF